MKENNSDLFKLDYNADIDGTHLLSHIEVPPVVLVELFGPPLPEPPSRTKITARYIFMGPSGDVFTIYDWKATSAYDVRNRIQPGEFWSSTDPKVLSIGGRANHSSFEYWINQKIKEFNLLKHSRFANLELS